MIDKKGNRCSGLRLKKTAMGNEVPRKSGYFLEIHSLMRLIFSNKEMVQALEYHRKRMQEGDNVSDIMDSDLHKYLEEHEKDFMQCPRNLLFGLSSDGTLVQKHAKQKDRTTGSGEYSMWPIILICYNLPPWLRYLSRYMFLVGLVDGPKPGVVGLMCALEVVIDQLLYIYKPCTYNPY